MYKNKQEFIYESSLRALQGSFANPNSQASVASMVRTAEQLWAELQDWELREKTATEPENQSS